MAITVKQKKVFKAVTENHRSVSAAMREAGYSASSATKPANLTNTKGWQELMEKYLPDNSLAQHHKKLLNSTRMDHMVFPLGPRGEDDINLSGGVNPKKTDEAEVPEELKERTTLTDKEIIEMLAEISCTVRRIVHGQTARHVYFWAADNRSKKEALDMAYKLKRRYGDEGGGDKTLIIMVSGQTMNRYELNPNGSSGEDSA